MEFEEKLRALMAEYGVNLRSLITMLDPQPSASTALPAGRTGARKERQLKVYRHPESGEVAETKGGNNKVFKAWKAEHGSDVVEAGCSSKRRHSRGKATAPALRKVSCGPC